MGSESNHGVDPATGLDLAEVLGAITRELARSQAVVDTQVGDLTVKGAEVELAFTVSQSVDGTETRVSVLGADPSGLDASRLAGGAVHRITVTIGPADAYGPEDYRYAAVRDLPEPDVRLPFDFWTENPRRKDR